MARTIQQIRKVELHQHVDGSIPPRTIWRLMKRHGLNPVPNLREMRRRLQLQEEEEGSLLSYLDKFHYPLWITQFYENIQRVTSDIVEEAYAHGVRLLELRYSPAIHTYAGLTPRQAIRSVLSGMNSARRRHPELEVGLTASARTLRCSWVRSRRRRAREPAAPVPRGVRDRAQWRLRADRARW